MGIRIEAIAVILTAMVSTVAAQGEKRTLLAEVIPEKQTVRLGDPIVVSVRVTNQAPETAEASRGLTAFNCFKVIGSDGQSLPYIGFDGQVANNPIEVRSNSTATLAESLDLTDKYLFQKPGRYSIHFSGQWTGLADSSDVAIDVAPGQLSEFSQIATALLPVCPNGWRLVKDGQGEVTPFGRESVSGFALHLCHSHMHGEAVLMWFTKAEAKVDPQQQPRGEIEYLGRVRELYVYASVGSNTPPLWPKAIEDISRVLQITKQ
jgi:hypothetical protein